MLSYETVFVILALFPDLATFYNNAGVSKLVAASGMADLLDSLLRRTSPMKFNVLADVVCLAMRSTDLGCVGVCWNFLEASDLNVPGNAISGEASIPKMDLGEIVRNISSVFGGLDLSGFPSAKSAARGRRGSKNHAAPDIGAITACVMKEVDKTHTKVWKYFILNQKKVVEACSKGEIVNLYRDIRKMFPGKPMTPLWTLLNEDPVLVCSNEKADEAEGGKHLYLNSYANNWFQDSGLEFRGQTVIVPMNQTKYVEMKTHIKTHLNRPKHTRTPLDQMPLAK